MARLCRINIIDAAKSSMCRHGVDAPLTDQAVCNTIKPVQCVIENEIFRSSTALRPRALGPQGWSVCSVGMPTMVLEPVRLANAKHSKPYLFRYMLSSRYAGHRVRSMRRYLPQCCRRRCTSRRCCSTVHPAQQMHDACMVDAVRRRQRGDST
jgi:hypothetical protein